MPFDDPAGFTAPTAFGPFRVLHQIGSGVLGPVFRTFEPQSEKLVAVKAFRLDVVPEVSARLADALRRIAESPVNHPAIVPVVGAGLEGTTAFLASEYIAAETLDVSVRHLAPARVEEALRLLRPLAEGLEAAWASGLGHGALHPRDIFVTAGTREGSVGSRGVRVTGVGVAAALEALRIPVQMRRPYGAPEREQGGPWDLRADVYSLGVITHELLTGRRPAGPVDQEPGQDEDTGEFHVGTTPEQRVALRRALAGALASDPARRYESPSAFVDALTTGAHPAVPGGSKVAVPVVAEPEGQPGLAAEVETGIEAGPETCPEADVPPGAGPLSDLLLPVGAQAGPGRPERLEPRYMDGILEAPYSGAPGETPYRTGRGALAVMLVLVLLAGTAFVYWLRGPSEPVPSVPVQEAGAQAPEEPFGTEVPVNQIVEPVPAPVAAAPAAASAPPVRSGAPESDPQRGRLLVRSVPSGATVFINGREAGTTPAAIRDLPFGTHTVTVSQRGYQRREQKLAISAAVPARSVTIELPPAATAASVAGLTGTVLVETRPAGASVSIDGRPVGTSPVRVPEMAPGSHAIRIVLAGHRSVTTTVVVRAGQQTAVRLSLEIQ